MPNGSRSAATRRAPTAEVGPASFSGWRRWRTKVTHTHTRRRVGYSNRLERFAAITGGAASLATQLGVAPQALRPAAKFASEPTSAPIGPHALKADTTAPHNKCRCNRARGRRLISIWSPTVGSRARQMSLSPVMRRIGVGGGLRVARRPRGSRRHTQQHSNRWSVDPSRSSGGGRDGPARAAAGCCRADYA